MMPERNDVGQKRNDVGQKRNDVGQKRNDGYAYRMQVGDARKGEYLSELLARKYQHSSRKTWLSRIHTGQVVVDEKVAQDDSVIQNGACVVWNRPSWLEPATPKTFTIEFEDDSIIVVGKPSGLPTLPSGGYLQNTLLHLVREQCSSCHPVHRLGTATSGLVLFAKSKKVASQISTGWVSVTKRYLAIAEGDVGEAEREIRDCIGRIPHPRLGTVYGASAAGKAARTTVRPVERRPGMSLVEATLITGRPHQIRIHMAAIDHPLVGDPMYAAGGSLRCDPGIPSDGGYFLHAHELVLMHPTRLDRCHFRLDAPAEFNRQFAARAGLTANAEDCC
ncbi:MAG: RluA family pseudouridine synthase [Aureliella sp.]